MTVGQKYTNIAILFHWLTAIFIMGLFPLGWYMVDLEGADKGYYYGLHKSLGLTIYTLILMRIFWRAKNKPPTLPNEFDLFHRRAAHLVHRMFYLFLVLMPVAGYLSSSFSGYTTKWFGIEIYYWGWKDEALNSIFSQIHVFCGYILILLIILHVGAVIFHFLSKKINLISRMWFHNKGNV